MLMRILFLFLFCLFCAPVNSSERLLVFAAASQRDAMTEIGKQYEKHCGCGVVFSFAATSTLARQIDAGADVDAFVSANEAWADWLQIRGRLDASSRSVVAGNRLVIASTAPTKDSLNILLRGRFAMADPVSVPAGIYAREALESLGVWSDVRRNAVFSENVRVALSSVRRGDLLSGIVYQSDLNQVSDIHAHYVFPEESHTPIHYVATAIKNRDEGSAFIDYLKTDAAQRVFQKYGFLQAPAIN